MNNRRLVLAAISSALLNCGCSASDKSTINVNLEGGEAIVAVRAIQDASKLNTNGIAIYGRVLVKADVRLKSVDLGCLVLLAAGTRSSKPYVNSVAHIMTNNYPADADGAVRAELYWVFQSLNKADFNPNSLRLAVDQSRGPCLTRAEPSGANK